MSRFIICAIDHMDGETVYLSRSLSSVRVSTPNRDISWYFTDDRDDAQVMTDVDAAAWVIARTPHPDMTIWVEPAGRKRSAQSTRR